jgi:hypothetical protein
MGSMTLIRGASSDTILDTLSEPSVYRLSSIVYRLSSIVYRLSSIVYRLSSVVRRPSST